MLTSLNILQVSENLPVINIPNCPGRGPRKVGPLPSRSSHSLSAFFLRSSSPPQTLSSSPPFPFTTTSPSTHPPSPPPTHQLSLSSISFNTHLSPAHAHSGDARSDVQSPFPCPIMALELQPPDGRKRVKVYELRENDWFDRGTGFCTGHISGVSLKLSSISSSSRRAHSSLVAPAVRSRDSFSPGRA